MGAEWVDVEMGTWMMLPICYIDMSENIAKNILSNTC